MKNSLRSLLMVTAVIELGAGLALLLTPSFFAAVLVGGPLEAPASLAIARMMGAALVSLAIACWWARDDAASRTVRGVVLAMLVYNVGVIAVLLHARMGFSLHGIGFWPIGLLHTVLAIWCVRCLQAKDASAA